MASTFARSLSVPPVPSTASAACTHDLGPGTTVCLRCRQEHRDAARARQQRLFALSGVAAMGLLGVYVMGASAASAWNATSVKDTTRAAARASVVASSVNGGREVTQQGTPTPARVASVPAAIAAAPAVPQPPVALIVREGRTELPDDVIFERGGDSVIVDFDTPATRTRRRDKFEAVVRRTLPMLYGARVDSVLRTIPDGGLAAGADLLTELPKRGVHLGVGGGWTLDLWPQTRPGQDGPLVVSYWARVSRDGALR
jgi:hypothetical protein